MSFVHARTFETRWGIGLAFIDLDDETDVEMLKLQLWAPLTESGDDAKVCVRIGMNAGASDAAHDLVSKANREALVEMDAARFEAVLDKSGVGQSLDDAFERVSA